MLNQLTQYLILNEKVSLAGIGSFSIEHIPARLDFINKAIQPPIPVIRFKNKVHELDEKLQTFISLNKKFGNTEEENQEINDILFDIKHKLSYNGEASLADWGMLKKDTNDNYTFEQSISLNDLFPGVHAERIVRTGNDHLVRTGDIERTSSEMVELLTEGKLQKDYWWVYALILTVAGIIVLLFYYLTN